MENKNLPNNFQGKLSDRSEASIPKSKICEFQRNKTKVINIINENGIKSLRPPQQKVLDNDLLDKNKNFLICIPTASGKTLIGEMAFINHLLDENKNPTNKKGLFIVPLKALATEKYEEFKEKYEKYGLKIGLSIGDFDEKEELNLYDLIITTAEKLDSLIRHKVEWINDISVVIVDEIHLIGDENRGGTLEIILTKLKQKTQKAQSIQIIGLSATIGNPEELAKWLNAKLIIDEWRPVELKKGIYYGNNIQFIEENNKLNNSNNITKNITKTKKPINQITKNNIFNLVVDCVLEDGSCLIFCNSKRGAVSEAKKLNLKKYLSKTELTQLTELKEDILTALDQPTETCKNLAKCIENGVAFHHAGLTYEQRKIVEEGFRKKLIKVICCTPTLCLNANTEILQESGFKKITELNKNEKVFALCGNKIKPVDCWKVHKTPQHDYNIIVKTANGLNITTTPNHLFLIKKGRKTCEKEANDLKVGEYVAIVNGKTLMNILNKNIKDSGNLMEMYNFLANLEKCPICDKPPHKEIRYGWKKGHYDGDIYWDTIKEIKKIKVNDKYAYDIELPDDGTNDHYVVANGFIVHNSAGLNLPCRRAIVRDLIRFTGKGMTGIPKMEIRQCIGRAGRPNLDPYGEGIIYMASEDNKKIDNAINYLIGGVEEIYSKLSNQKVLRTHILGLISTGEVKTSEDLEDFIKNTFYTHQYQNTTKILYEIDEIVSFLEQNKFIECSELKNNEKGEQKNKTPKVKTLIFGKDNSISIKSSNNNNSYKITSLGKKVSELYIDPLSAEIIINDLKSLSKKYGNKSINSQLPSLNQYIIYMLYSISKTTEMQPSIRVKKDEEQDLIYQMMDMDIEEINGETISCFKNAKMFYDWINEYPEDKLLKKYAIEPGILRYKVEQAKWMVHSAKEIFNLLNMNDNAIKDSLYNLEIRIEYGAKEDIMELLKIKHIGRARARKLYNSDIKNRQDISNNPKKVVSLFGEKISKKIFDQLNMQFEVNQRFATPKVRQMKLI